MVLWVLLIVVFSACAIGGARAQWKRRRELESRRKKLWELKQALARIAGTLPNEPPPNTRDLGEAIAELAVPAWSTARMLGFGCILAFLGCIFLGVFAMVILKFFDPDYARPAGRHLLATVTVSLIVALAVAIGALIQALPKGPRVPLEFHAAGVQLGDQRWRYRDLYDIQMLPGRSIVGLPTLDVTLYPWHGEPVRWAARVVGMTSGEAITVRRIFNALKVDPKGPKRA